MATPVLAYSVRKKLRNLFGNSSQIFNRCRISISRIEAATAGEGAVKEQLDGQKGLIQTGESANSLVVTKRNELLDSWRRTGLQRNGTMARPRQATGEPLEANRIKLD